LHCGQIDTQEFRETAELKLEENEFGQGKGRRDGGQDVRTTFVVRFAIEIEKRNPFEAFGEELEDVFVQGGVDLVAEAEVNVGEDVASDGEQEEGQRVGQVELVEGAAWKLDEKTL
jgi:hypothetical protein